jgi:ankyrin repeat protein
VNTADKDGLTPLYAAGQNGHVEVMQELLNCGAHVLKSTKAGQKFINLAFEKGYFDLIRDVLQ